MPLGHFLSHRRVGTRRWTGLVAVILWTAVVHGSSTIDLGVAQQRIAGFGGINFPRWIDDLTPEQCDLAFGNGPRQLGFSILRIGISPDSAQWGLELPTARRARGFGAKVFASPWSPPAWMKTSDTIVKGELRESSQADYARHLARFAGFMSDSGVDLHAISVQNEPDLEPDYEGCGWSPSRIRDFLRVHAREIPTRIIASESMGYDKSYTDPILEDSAASASFDIVGVHLYGATPSSYPLAVAKGKELWMTEHYTTSDRSADLWPDALEVGKEIHGCMASGFGAYVWWYIRRFYGPITDSGVVSKRGWNMAHYSKFVRPGFVRVEMPEAPAPGVLATAYRNGDQVVVVAINTSDTAVPCSFSLSRASKVPTAFRRFTTSATKNLADDGEVAVTDSSFSVQFDARSITTLATPENTVGIGRVLRDPREVVPGEYLVVGIDGSRHGVVRLDAGSGVERPVRRLVRVPGVYLVRPLQGGEVLRVQAMQ